MSDDASLGKAAETLGKSKKKKTGVHCMAPGCTNWYYKCKDKTFHRLPRKDLQRKRWLQILKLACPPEASSARVCSDHFSDADYKKKNVCDRNGQTVSVKTLFLIKDAIPSLVDFSGYDYASTDYSSAKLTRKQEISEGRAVRRKRRAKTMQVSKLE